MLLILFIIPAYSVAEVFDLSYSLTEGGYQLELNPANPYKGVKIGVNSDVSTQYEILQEVIVPLENRDKPATFIRENFVMRRISEGNATGTFHVQSNDILVNSVARIYTSNTAGSPVNFTLVYGLTNLGEIVPGHYYGRIRFTLKPLASTREQVSRYLDVYVTISEEEVKPSIEIIPVTGLSTIYLNSQKEEKKVFDVQVKINKDFNTSSTIYQILMQQLQSLETGDQLDYEAVNYVVSEVTKGKTDANRVTAFSSGMMNIYRSEPNGQVDNDFIITYGLGDLSESKAGRYRGKIQYYLEQGGKSKFLGSLDLGVENERIFELVITPEEQKSIIEFRDLKPREPPKKCEVTIQIKTNAGKQYQVSQSVLSELTNEEGDIIPFKNFTLKTESLDTKGSLKFLDKQVVRKGDAVLFVSSPEGSPDKFKVIYELTCPWDAKGGNYSTRITYSLVEI